MKSCLVVDDSKVIRKIIRNILDGLDFEIEEAEDGQEAYDACMRGMPDIILLDWNMPVLNGIDFLRKLRANRRRRRAGGRVCTTVNDIEHIREAMDAGANEYIMKPFDGDILEAKLAQVGMC